MPARPMTLTMSKSAQAVADDAAGTGAGIARRQFRAQSVKKKSAASSQAAPASSSTQNPITARGQIRASKASLMMPNQMNPTGSR